MIPEQNVKYLQSAVDNDVQAAYAKFLKGCMIDDMRDLKSRTGIPPRLDVDDIQAAYRKLIAERTWDFLYLQCLTDVRPKMEKYGALVQRSYSSACGKDNGDARSKVLVGYIYESTGMAPSSDTARKLDLEERPLTTKKLMEILLQDKMSKELKRLRAKKARGRK